MEAKTGMARVHHGALSDPFPEGDYEMTAVARQGNRNKALSVALRRENLRERLSKRLEKVRSSYEALSMPLEKTRNSGRESIDIHRHGHTLCAGISGGYCHGKDGAQKELAWNAGHADGSNQVQTLVP